MSAPWHRSMFPVKPVRNCCSSPVVSGRRPYRGWTLAGMLKCPRPQCEHRVPRRRSTDRQRTRFTGNCRLTAVEGEEQTELETPASRAWSWCTGVLAGRALLLAAPRGLGLGVKAAQRSVSRETRSHDRFDLRTAVWACGRRREGDRLGPAGRPQGRTQPGACEGRTIPTFREGTREHLPLLIATARSTGNTLSC